MTTPNSTKTGTASLTKDIEAPPDPSHDPGHRLRALSGRRAGTMVVLAGCGRHDRGSAEETVVEKTWR
ncbi:hypothetical protein PUR61_36735, partial [Streptomyces sp. BE20]|uniref:hypothetical protein n=1 Tax=Streptomyces sp. BE20 TaxID=3002525 RepID=UPI002E76E523